MELWDVYDFERIKNRANHGARGEPIEKGTYHLVVNARIFNSKGEMLIQQRQPFKSPWPNMWIVGGSAVMGDTSQVAMERELLEKSGWK